MDSSAPLSVISRKDSSCKVGAVASSSEVEADDSV